MRGEIRCGAMSNQMGTEGGNPRPHQDGKDTTDTASSQDRYQDRRTHKTKAVTVIRIAPPSAAEENDRRAVRCRTRRERPRKLQLVGHDKQDDVRGDSKPHPSNLFEPDVESFVSNCIPGVSFVTGHDSTNNEDPRGTMSQRRAKLIRKRSLPLLSFLSSISLAAAEKKRKIEERERYQALAEEEAKKMENYDYTIPTPENDTINAKAEPVFETSNRRVSSEMEVIGQTGRLTFENNIQHRGNTPTEINRQTATVFAEPPDSKPTTTTTVTMEKTSNILMPPLLDNFLTSLKKIPR